MIVHCAFEAANWLPVGRVRCESAEEVGVSRLVPREFFLALLWTREVASTAIRNER